MEGWIGLHRKIQESPVYKSLNAKQRDVLIQCLLMANHQKKEWEWEGKPYECERGQFITSLDSITRNCGNDVKVQSVRTALLKLEKWRFLTSESTKTGRLITICNWETYQSKEGLSNKATNKALTKDQQSSNKALTPNKNGENGKKQNVDGYSDEFSEWWAVYKKGNKSAAFKRWKEQKPNLPVNLIELTRQYLDYCKKTDRALKDGEGYLNGRYWEGEWTEQAQGFSEKLNSFSIAKPQNDFDEIYRDKNAESDNRSVG